MARRYHENLSHEQKIALGPISALPGYQQIQETGKRLFKENKALHDAAPDAADDEDVEMVHSDEEGYVMVEESQARASASTDPAPRSYQDDDFTQEELQEMVDLTNDIGSGWGRSAWVSDKRKGITEKYARERAESEERQKSTGNSWSWKDNSWWSGGNQGDWSTPHSSSTYQSSSTLQSSSTHQSSSSYNPDWLQRACLDHMIESGRQRRIRDDSSWEIRSRSPEPRQAPPPWRDEPSEQSRPSSRPSSQSSRARRPSTGSGVSSWTDCAGSEATWGSSRTTNTWSQQNSWRGDSWKGSRWG